jgi:DNA mismatch repair protein MutS2
MSVATAFLVGTSLPPSEPSSTGTAPGARARATGLHRLTHPEPQSEAVVDVRGKAADDAIESVVAALDRAALAGSPRLRIVHGHGTGRLRTAVRDYLKTSPYVSATRTGERAEGGDGVTIVDLK